MRLEAVLSERIPGVTFGTATINGVQVSACEAALWKQVMALCERQENAFSLEKLAGETQISAVRGLQRSFGFDPTRYRPSSEALLRRVLKGQGLHQVNSAVDVNNLCSLEFLLPMCIYDLRHVRGQMRVRLGEPGEAYPGIGRQQFQVENKVIIADDEGVMGSTVSDSERTKVTTETRDIFLAIYAPAGSNQRVIEQYATLAAQRMVAFNGGHVGEVSALVV